MGKKFGSSKSLAQGWKKDQIKKKWRSILAVFITITLFFAIAAGLARGFSFKNKLSQSRWDGNSSFLVAVDSYNPSVFVYQTDPKRVIVLTISGDTIYGTGKFDKPLVKISESLGNNLTDLTTLISHLYGVKVSNKIYLDERKEMDKHLAQRMLLDFASIVTPLKIMTAGWNNNLKDTNITRIDAIRLWWQLKSLSLDQLELTDLSKYKEEIIDKNSDKVLGADIASLHRVVAKYTENLKVLEEKYNVEIANGSGTVEAAKLASNFAESIGGNVTKISHLEFEQGISEILAGDKNSYTALYLANIFDCDIKEAKSEDSKGEITVILGADFAKTYFE